MGHQKRCSFLYRYIDKPDKHMIYRGDMLMPKEMSTAGITNNKDVTDTADVITKHTIDNITYTIKARSSETAKHTLQEKLDAGISRDIMRIFAN